MSVGLLVILFTAITGASSAVILYLWRDDVEPEGHIKPGLVRAKHREIADLKHWEEPRLTAYERQLSLTSMAYVIRQEPRA